MGGPAFAIRTLRLLLIWQLMFAVGAMLFGVFGLPWLLALVGITGAGIGCWATSSELAACKRAGDMDTGR